MEVISRVPEAVLNLINKEGVCYAKNQTTYSEYAYSYLKELTGYSGLFFGIGVNDYAVRNKEHVEDLTALSSTNNVISLTLDIPVSEFYPHDYYSFSDLIFYHDEEEFDTVETIKKELQEPQLNDVIQCVFDRIEKDWIKEVKKL